MDAMSIPDGEARTAAGDFEYPLPRSRGLRPSRTGKPRLRRVSSTSCSTRPKNFRARLIRFSGSFSRRLDYADTRYNFSRTTCREWRTRCPDVGTPLAG